MEKMREESRNDHLAIDIDQKLSDISYPPSRPSIHKVSDCLRSTNAKAYDPRIVAIGPFHHGKDHLKYMEHQKMIFLKLLRKSRNESSVCRYVKAIRKLEGRARKCYSEAITLEDDKFVHMLLFDGIFILEFLRGYELVDVLIFQPGTDVTDVLHDLVLLENQIPFFVLEELFNLTKIHDQEKLSDLIRPLVSWNEIPEGISSYKAPHLLGLVHHVRCSSFAQILSRKPKIDDVAMEKMNSATDLKGAGIHFKKPKDERTNSLDIKFKKKKIYIASLDISDVTESSFRNMIAYEHNLPSSHPKYITDYTFFLHCLIHSPRDAELLRRKGIISNWLGGDERVHKLINQLGTNAQISERFSYSDVFDSINRHCRHRRNRWIAVLRRNYFNSPWSLISLVAAIILLSVSVVQMVFAILSYRHDLKS